MVSKALVFGITSLFEQIADDAGSKSVILLAAVDSPLPAAS
jgi:hypothetical protein